MPKPLSTRELVRRLKNFGFFGPFSGGKHEYMTKDSLCVVVPNPHGGDISGNLIGKLIRQAGISAKDFENNK
ncbi:MAG: type II toxin-antitoxin system HicA family toxin [Candidatus Vogelbacteria bacterium]|nr:type II toxin-antitoxin system HicA family toxin [Candidatus Vogelbacteria bacterium]